MRVEFNPTALYEVRREPGVIGEVEKHAARITSAAGRGFKWSSRQGMKRPQGRWRAIVFADTWGARRRDARDNLLLKAMGGGR